MKLPMCNTNENLFKAALRMKHQAGKQASKHGKVTQGIRKFDFLLVTLLYLVYFKQVSSCPGTYKLIGWPGHTYLQFRIYKAIK